jgi:phage gp46-like protein
VTDISLTFDPTTATCDWTITSGQITEGNDLETAVLISLFTDARAAPGYVSADGTNDLHGFWGDTYSQTNWGSRLWQLDRASISNRPVILQAAQNYATEALQWLIDDGVAATISATVSFLTPNTISLSVTITEPSKGNPSTFAWAWDILSAAGQ